MEKGILKGLSFGLTSGIITTLGLIIGLNSASHSKLVIISGILVIAIADSMSDALGIHIAEESSTNDQRRVWQATLTTLVTKMFFALSFILPIVSLPHNQAITASIIWGLSLIIIISYYIAKISHEKKYWIIVEHLGIAIVVIILSNLAGTYIKKIFNQ